MRRGGARDLGSALAFSVLAGVAFFVASVALGDIRAVGEGAGSIGVTGWGMVLGLSVLNYVLRFARWHGYLADLGHRVPAGRSAHIYLGGFALTTTPGKAGEAIRSLYLMRHGVEFPDSLSALFVERLMDMVAMVLLAALALLVVPQAQWAVAVLAVTVVALLPLLRSDWVAARLEGLQGRLEA